MKNNLEKKGGPDQLKMNTPKKEGTKVVDDTEMIDDKGRDKRYIDTMFSVYAEGKKVNNKATPKTPNLDKLDETFID